MQPAICEKPKMQRGKYVKKTSMLGFVLLPSLKLTARLKIDHPKRKGLSSSPIHFQEREMLVSGRVVLRSVQYYLLVGG